MPLARSQAFTIEHTTTCDIMVKYKLEQSSTARPVSNLEKYLTDASSEGSSSTISTVSTLSLLQ